MFVAAKDLRYNVIAVVPFQFGFVLHAVLEITQNMIKTLLMVAPVFVDGDVR